MSNPGIIYNGISSETLGLIVTRLPDFHRAAYRVSEVTIPGRSGQLVQDDGGYDLYSTALEINCNGVDLRTVYAWLRGEGWMISTDEPDYKAYVYLYAQADDERFRAAGTYDTLSFSLRVEPFLRLVNEEAVVLTENANTFQGQGHDATLPFIHVEASGDVTLMVNGATAYLTEVDGDIWLDCEAGVAYTEAEGVKAFAGTQVTLEDGEWPYLLPEGGANLVSWTGSVARVTLQPNWRFL